MKNQKNISSMLGILFVIAIYIIIISVTKIGCPIKWLTGIPCPGCGITRSCIAFLNLDFKAAFEYHALTLIVIPAFVYILFGKRPLFKSVRREKIFFAVLLTIMIGYYIFRLIIQKNDIIYIDISSSFVVKLIKIFKELFS